MNIIHLNKTQKTQTSFPVVAISTASSEIEVLKKVISEFPADSGMAYLIMEDLSFPQTQNLALELQSHSQVPVVEIVSNIDLHPNHIYIIPENNFLEIENEVLVLRPRTRSSTSANCLDFFFDSLAKIYKSYTVGLVISGSSVDSFAGLKKVKEMGGTSVAVLHKKGIQKNATTADFIDFFVPPDQIADRLQDIQNSYLANHAYEEQNDTTDEEEILSKIIAILYKKTKTDFKHYKRETIRRRIAKRMVTTHQSTLEKYLNFLEDNSSEQLNLFHDTLIPVTYFFRDQPFFDYLSSSVFPSLVENSETQNLRIWSAGCSTGEEAYSLAICLHEYLEQNNKLNFKVRIFASDLSEDCINKARTGIYTAQDIKNISSERIEKYFVKGNNGYHVGKIIREMCVFAIHDLSRDIPFSKTDFICCRNVLIYFDAELQNQVLASFHYSLRNNGFLFLGKSESAGNAADLFSIVHKQEKIYVRKSDANLKNTPSRFEFAGTSKLENAISKSPEIDYKKIASDILLENFSPAAVMVNEQLEIVYFHGDTSPFLQPASGKPSFNVVHMVREEIRFELRNAILKARNAKKNILSNPIAVKKQPFLTSFEVIYLPSNPDLLLIILCKKTVSLENQDAASNRSGELEKELLQLRGDFKKVTEEQQIYFEELQTTNEELLTNTEELQLINEKLTASAEELQSNNQELSCLNDELQNRQEELAILQNFYESIVKTIRGPLITIDKNAIIKSANPSFYKYFKVLPEETEGSSLFDIGICNWNIPQFKESVLSQLIQGKTIENFKIQFSLDNGVNKTMLLNASPIINSVPQDIFLLALEDITELEFSHETLKNKNQELQNYNKELESFTTAASHNLLEPGRKIYMFGKKVLDNEKSLTESGKDNLKRLLNTAVNLNQLIEDLINYSIINFSEKSFKKIDLNVIVKKTISELKSTIQEHKANIVTDLLPTIYGISCQMKQLFSHLIINSIKYAKKDEIPEIKISSENPTPEDIASIGADSNRNYVKIMVKDNGIGFTKDFETLIFAPFYKLHSNERHYGSGLGLTLVHKIASNHNGFIHVSSKPEKGTLICIYLPS